MLTDEEIIRRIPSACVNDDTELFSLALSELVTFALDHADEDWETGMRCNVDLDAV